MNLLTIPPFQEPKWGVPNMRGKLRIDAGGDANWLLTMSPPNTTIQQYLTLPVREFETGLSNNIMLHWTLYAYVLTATL